MYIKIMTVTPGTETTISVAEALAHLAATIEAAQTGPVRLQRRGRTSAVMISEAVYEQLLDAAGDAQDAAAITEATAAIAAGEPTIPWEQVEVDLGWS